MNLENDELSMDLLYQISIGKERIPRKRFSSIQEADILLNEISNKMKNVKIGNNSFETDNYYMYVGCFPSPHIAIDNKSGTTRLFSFFNKEEYEKNKEHLSFI